MTLKIGIIGAGRIGKVHAETVQTRILEAEVACIADVNAAAAQEAAQRYGIPKATGNYQDILQDKSIEAVFICSSTDTHAPITIEAAQAGKHIFCEKPIDLTLEKIDQVLAAVKKAGIKFQVGFNRRFDPNFARVRQAVENKEIGDVHMIHIISRDPAPPPAEYAQASGGMFLDMTIHDFDMARFLIGSGITEVYTSAAVRVDPKIGEAGDVDTAVIMLKFANGVIGTIDNSRKAVYGYDQRVEVFGSGGMIATSNNYPNSAVISGAQHINRDLPLNFFMQRYMESYQIEIQAFVEAVLHNKPIPANGEDGRAAVVVGLAARRSYDEKRPISL